MPGNPIRRKMVAAIEAAGGLEIAVFDRLQDGETLTAIARDPYGVSRSTLWRYLKETPDRHANYKAAQQQGADGMVDKSRDLLSDASVHAKDSGNSAYVQATRNEVDFIRWQAAAVNRETYGQPDRIPQVSVNIEHLHLGSLQANGAPKTDDLTEIVLGAGDAPQLRPGDNVPRGEPSEPATSTEDDA